MCKKRILLIEPYFGGSHKQFLQGLMKYVPADYTLLHLPARQWKMRMQLSAPWFAGKIREMRREDRSFDLVLMSSFIDVAVFRVLAGQVPGWSGKTRFYTYFHENQFAYPGILPETTNHQFAAINFTTALASDYLAFNSKFNRKTFLDGCRRYIRKSSDMRLGDHLDAIEQKSRVLYPGIDFEPLDTLQRPPENHAEPLIIWNHRWEHDKNPEEFFQVLFRLKDAGLPFRLAVLGQSFRKRPAVFDEAGKRLIGEKAHFGFVKDKDAYYRILKEGHLVVSTSHHEFFGIAILEAVRAGCRPLVPNRLSYPELFEQQYLYEEGNLYTVMSDYLLGCRRPGSDRCVALTEPYSWNSMARKYTQWLEG